MLKTWKPSKINTWMWNVKVTWRRLTAGWVNNKEKKVYTHSASLKWTVIIEKWGIIIQPQTFNKYLQLCFEGGAGAFVFILCSWYDAVMEKSQTWWNKRRKTRRSLKIRGITFTEIHFFYCLCSSFMVSERLGHFSIVRFLQCTGHQDNNIVMLQYKSIFFFKKESRLLSSALRSFDLSDTVTSDGGVDWCSVCRSMTVHIKVDTPSERVSTSARHVSAQEFRQCRQTFFFFSSTNKTFLLPL